MGPGSSMFGPLGNSILPAPNSDWGSRHWASGLPSWIISTEYITLVLGWWRKTNNFITACWALGRKGGTKWLNKKEQSGIAAMNAHYDTEAELWPFTSHLHPGLLTLHPSGPHYKQLSQYFTPGYTLTNKQLDQRLWWRSRNLTSKGVGICCDTRWVNRKHRSQLKIEIWCLINWWQIAKPCKSVSFLPLWNKVDSSIGR